MSGEAKLEDLQAAAVRGSSDAGSHYALAKGYWEKKQWDEAERAPQLNRQELAREAFSRFLAIAPTRFASWIEDARQRLSTLQ